MTFKIMFGQNFHFSGLIFIKQNIYGIEEKIPKHQKLYQIYSKTKIRVRNYNASFKLIIDFFRMRKITFQTA